MQWSLLRQVRTEAVSKNVMKYIIINLVYLHSYPKLKKMAANYGL